MVPFQRNAAIRRSRGLRRGKAELLTGYPRFSKGSIDGLVGKHSGCDRIVVISAPDHAANFQRDEVSPSSLMHGLEIPDGIELALAEQEEIPRSVRIDVRVCDVCVPSYGDQISYRILHTLTGQEGMHNIEVQFHQRAIDLLNDPQGSFRSVNGSP
jgi:hypothetical protein